MQRAVNRTLVYSVILILAWNGTCFSQSSLGELVGFTKTSEGILLKNVEIEVLGPNLINSRITRSNSRGYYRISYIPPGIYTLRAAKNNYSTTIYSDIHIRGGRVSNFNILLAPGEFNDTVSLAVDRPLIDTTSVKKSITFSSEIISEIALSPNKEWTDTFILIPSAFADSEFVYTSNENSFLMQLHGSPQNQNMFTLDTMIIQSVGDFRPVFLPSNSIKEIEVITSGIDAGIKSGLGAHINIVTKSGSNEFNGSVSFTNQSMSWNSNQEIDGVPSPKQALYIPEITFSGPLIKDKTTFFVNYMYDVRREKIYRRKEILELYDRLELARPSSNNSRDAHRWFAKLNHNFDQDQSLDITYLRDQLNDEITSTVSTDDGRYNLRTGGEFFSARYSKEYKNGFRFSISAAYRSDEQSMYAADILKSQVLRAGETWYYPSNNLRISKSDSVLYHGGVGSEYVSRAHQSEIKLDADYLLNDFAGDHILQVGFYYIPFQDLKEYENHATPTIVKETLNASGEWQTYAEIYKPNSVYEDSYQNSSIAAYIQDRWSLGEKINISAGIRIGKNLDPLSTLDHTYVNRHLGFTYTFGGNQDTGIRFSYSRRHNLVNRENLFPSFEYNRQSGYLERHDDDLDGVFDRIITVGTIPPTINSPNNISNGYYPQQFAPDLHLGYVNMFQAGFRTIIPFNIILDISLIYNEFKDQIKDYPYYGIVWKNNKPYAFKDLQNPTIYYRANDKWSAEKYMAFELTLSKQISSEFMFISSYSNQSKKITGQWSPYDPESYYFDQSWFDYSDADELPRHSLRFAAVYFGPWGLNFATSLSYRSSRPAPPPFVAGSTVTRNPFQFAYKGTTVLHPFYSMDILTQPRSHNRETLYDAASVINVSLGKSFSFKTFVADIRLQIYNLFNDSTIIAGDYRRNDPDTGEPVVGNLRVQSSKSTQVLLRVRF